MSASAPLAGRRPVIADLWSKTRVADTVLVLGAALLTAASAQLVIPLAFTPASITGGTFAVLLTAAALGPVRGMAGQLVYLALGAIGLPFFTGGASGLSFLAGANGGYVFGFVLAAVVVGTCARRGWDRRPLGMAAAFALGSVVIYAVGVPWLAVAGGFSAVEAVVKGLLPFLLGDTLKAVLAAVALPASWRIAGDGRS